VTKAWQSAPHADANSPQASVTQASHARVELVDWALHAIIPAS
jgi:hypothetical protein